MTRDAYDKATVALTRVEKLKAIKEKLKREFPEFEYDSESKEIGTSIFRVLDSRITQEQNDFNDL